MDSGKPAEEMNRLCMAAIAVVGSGAAFGIMVQPSQWSVISNDILGELGKVYPAPTDPYATVTAGISVDRTNGDVYMLANNIGICKSTDQGKSFRLVSGSAVTGRFETGWGLNIDPNGRRLMCFAIYGSSAYSADAGKTWKKSSVSHLDYGAVDWADSGKALLAIGHESGGKLLFSSDTGETWQTLGTGFWGAGMFDRKKLLSRKDGIQRSGDAGQSWTKVSDEPIAAPVMVLFKGIGYWLGEHGLLVSKDKGLTWMVSAGTPKGATLGPMFGRDERTMVVGSPDGLFESKDSGKTWVLLAPLAPEIKVLKGGLYGTYGWDSIHNIVYASQMRMPAYRFVVGRG